MSEVRDELTSTIRGLKNMPSEMVAEAILARFEVTPRPAVTAEELGRMVNRAATFSDSATVGVKFGVELGRAGLRIVREEREQG